MSVTLAWLRRHWIWVLLATGLAVLLATESNTLKQAAVALVHGNWAWLAAALALQVVYYVMYVVLYQHALAAVGVRSHWLKLLPVFFVSIVAKAVVPSGGISSLAVFVDDAVHRGESGARTVEGGFLVVVADLLTMLPLVGYLLVFLGARGALVPYQSLASAFFALFVLGMVALLLLGRLRPQWLRGALQWLQQRINGLTARLHRPAMLQSGWAETQAAEYIGAARDMSKHPREVAVTLSLAFLAHLVNAASFLAVILAYGGPASFGTAIAGLSANVVFSVINFVPHGIGVAEGVIALLLISIGMAHPTGVAIAVAFRAVDVWLTLFVGLLCLRHVGARRRRSTARSQPIPIEVEAEEESASSLEGFRRKADG